jgi:hypothetical protein
LSTRDEILASLTGKTKEVTMRVLSLVSLLQLQLSLFSRSHVSAATVGSSPVKSVVEYALPAAAETHEIVAVSDNLLLISQQTDGSLLKVSLAAMESLPVLANTLQRTNGPVYTDLH